MYRGSPGLSSNDQNTRLRSNDPDAYIQAELGQESSEFYSSEEDDKDDPNFWRKDQGYDSLPRNVQHAIEVSKEKAKHSEFYYRLKGLNEKIYTYK